MELVLTLEGGAGGTAERQRRLTSGRLSIGRMPDNDWVLPDPERLLSKHHCLIENRNGAWMLTDTSTNGVYLDNSPVAVGPGGTAQLRDGMRLKLGDHVLRVAVSSEARYAQDLPAIGTGGKESKRDLFDDSWFKGKPLEAPAHPIRVDRGPAFSRPDHLPADQVALDLPRRPGPFGEHLPPPGRPAAEPAKPTPFLDLDWRGPPAAAPAAPPPVLEPPLPTAPPAPPPTQAAAVPAADAHRLLVAFLEGAGLSAADARGVDAEALLRELGGRYRAMAGGLVELLVLRATLKQESGLERTLIAAADNNPLKLTATAGEAVRWLVFPRGQGYLPPDQAIAAAVADLKSFLPVFVQAMQQALRALLRRFDPAVLEEELTDASFLERLAAGGRKARFWELFKERYRDHAREAEQQFLRDVGVDIARPNRGATGDKRR
ncbi:MAG: type VI secretion system-associated FHA domain protein TagH [Geminicoccaceae bacterium]